MIFLNGSFKQILGSNSEQIFLSVHQKSKVVLIMCNILCILRTQMLKVTRNMGWKIVYLLNSPLYQMKD